MAEGLGDHILLLRLWDEWEASGCSRDVAKELGLDPKGMGFARDIRRQLEGKHVSAAISFVIVTMPRCVPMRPTAHPCPILTGLEHRVYLPHTSGLHLMLPTHLQGMLVTYACHDAGPGRCHELGQLQAVEQQ